MSRLGSLVSAEAAHTERLLVVPLGATEQHGPHLPLDTDTEIAAGLADRLAARCGSVLIAPALPYGSSGEHQSFPGTISVGQQAVETLLVELVRSATKTFARVLLVSAHGGNAACVARAVRRLRAEARDVLAWSPAEAWLGNAHAGLVETSVMLALAPARVDMARAAAGNTRPLRELMPALVCGGVAQVSDNGVLGDPTAATSERGHALLARAVDDLAGFIGRWPGLGA